jgi:hypothetical protein
MDFHANEVNVPVLLWSKMEAWADLDKIRLFTTAEGGFIFLIHNVLLLKSITIKDVASLSWFTFF